MATVDIIQLLKSDEGEKFYPVTHKNAVIGLEDSSFFEAVQDENDSTKFSVKLKSEYTGLWADGWIAAGGVGTGGSGGGGGLIETVYTWTELQTMSVSPADDYSTAFNAKALYETYKRGLDSITSRQDGSVDFNFRNGDVTTIDLNHRHPDLEQAIAAIQSLELVPVATLPTADATTFGKIYLIPSSNPQTQNIKDEYVTIRNGSEGAYTYYWEQIGTTAVDLTGYALLTDIPTSLSQLSDDSTHRLVTDTQITSWTAKYDKPSGGIPLTDLAALYVGTTAVQSAQTAQALTGILSVKATSDTESLMEYDENNDAWRFHGNLYADGWVAAGGVGQNSSVVGELNDLADVAISSVSLANGHLLVYNSTTSKWENKDQSEIVPTISVVNNAATLTAGQTVTLGSVSGIAITATVPSFLTSYTEQYTGTITGITMNGVSKGTSGVVDLGTVLTSHQSVTNRNATLSAGQSVTLATVGSTDITATVPSFVTSSDLSGYVPSSRTINGADLSINRTLYVGTTELQTTAQSQSIAGVSSVQAVAGTSVSKMEWDVANGAWHFYGNVYADGWMAAGGVGSGGGGGFGVEQITSQSDGTVDFHFTGGDVVTVDLNHEHQQYPKYVLCASESAYNAITTKDSSTLYLIPTS